MLQIQDIALVVAVATPLAVFVALNAFLYLRGERDTLLIPGIRRFPSLPVDAEPVAVLAEEPGIVVIEEEPLRKAA